MNKKILSIFLILFFLLTITSCKITKGGVEESVTAIETTPIQNQEGLEQTEASIEYEDLTENIAFYLIQLEIITDSDWTTLVTENTEDIKTVKLENKIGDVSKYVINSKYIWLDQCIEAAEQNKKVGLTVNYAVPSNFVDPTIDFVIYKGDLNTTSINIYYIGKAGKELIQEIEHSGVAESSASLNPKEFSIDLSILKEFEANKAEIKYKESIPKTVWAFYYPWYKMDAWDSDVLSDKPISPYDSSDPLAIEKHIDEAKGLGIDGFISSWWGPESITDNNLKVLLDVARDKDFSVSIIFETLADYGPRDKQEIKNWLEFVIREYGSHPAFAKVEGKPVIVLYETGSVPLEIWKQIIEELRKNGNDAVFIAMGYNIDNLEVFDGIYEYGVFNIMDHEELYRAVSSTTHYYQIFNNSDKRKIFAATVQPGYDDRLIPGREGTLKDREEGSFYISTFNAAVKSDPDYIFITSWNEWLENTHIERSELYGDVYLNITKEYAIKWKEGEEESTLRDTSIFLDDKNLDEDFVGLPLSKVEQLQQSKGWPPAFPFDPSKTTGFTAEVCEVQVYDTNNEQKNVKVIVFNLPPKTDIVASMLGALTLGGGDCSENGCKTLEFGLNNELGRIQYVYPLKEAIQPIDMDKLVSKSFQEGDKLFTTTDYIYTTNSFMIAQTQKEGNLLMVMREPCSEFDCPLMSMDFNSFLKDEKGRIVYIDNKSNETFNQSSTTKNMDTVLSNKSVSSITFPIKIKALVLNYDPMVESQGNKYLHELCGFNNPKELAQGYIDDLNNCSGGRVIYEIVDWIDINDIIPYTDGFKYTGESFYENFQKACSETNGAFWSWNGWHAYEKNQATGMADYRWIINTNNLITRINSGEVDEVLVFAQSFSGMYESIMIGPNSIWCNSNPMIIPELNKNFIIMGFNYERGVDCMLENFGHRVESILSNVFSSNKIKGVNYWEKFTLYDKIAPGESGCGNVHFAPNSTSDYDWGNKRYVDSNCDSWLNYPNLTWEKRKVNCSEWGNGDMRLHHIWWLTHIPKADGLDYNGMLNNWWGYFTKLYKF